MDPSIFARKDKLVEDSDTDNLFQSEEYDFELHSEDFGVKFSRLRD